MGALSSLPRIWWSTDLPGFREHPRPFATYSAFPFSELPRIERRLDPGLEWLLAQPKVQGSLGQIEPADPVPERPATRAQLATLLAGKKIDLPPAFKAFISEPEPRLRVRSATACYLDLAEFPVEVAGGGSLIHFLSDQQWILHWLVYAGADGSEAVLVTETPLGFEADEQRFASFDPASEDASVCAESFSEFLYRLWIENEIYFRALHDAGERSPLTEEQRRYAEHYH